MDFTQLFEIKRLDEHDLAILKLSNFIEFLKFLPESELIKFKAYQKLICPQDIQGTQFKKWVIDCLEKSELKQNLLCQRVSTHPINVSTTKLSKFLNDEGELTLEERFAVKTELKRELISKGLMKP